MPVSVSFTWISSLTVCAVSSRSRPRSVHRRLLIVKRSVRLQSVKVSTSVSPVVVVSMVTYGSALNRTKKARALNSSMRRSAEAFRANTSKPTEEGLEDALEKGMIAGYPVIDIKATLFDGSYHDVDSSEMAYKIAAIHGVERSRLRNVSRSSWSRS